MSKIVDIRKIVRTFVKTLEKVNVSSLAENFSFDDTDYYVLVEKWGKNKKASIEPTGNVQSVVEIEVDEEKTGGRIITYKNGLVTWVNKKGQLHREDGPARIWPEESKLQFAEREQWFLNGELVKNSP